MNNIIFYDKEEFQKELERLKNHPKRGYFCVDCERYFMIEDDPKIAEHPHICTRCHLQRIINLGGV